MLVLYGTNEPLCTLYNVHTFTEPVTTIYNIVLRRNINNLSGSTTPTGEVSLLRSTPSAIDPLLTHQLKKFRVYSFLIIQAVDEMNRKRKLDLSPSGGTADSCGVDTAAAYTQLLPDGAAGRLVEGGIQLLLTHSCYQTQQQVHQ